MHTLFAAGLFENPLVILVMLLAAALVNWLVQKRQREIEQQDERQDSSTPPRAGKPPFETETAEAMLRRLLEGEPPSSAQPPPLHGPRHEQAPDVMWEEAQELSDRNTPREESGPPITHPTPPPIPWRERGFTDLHNRQLTEPPPIRLAQVPRAARPPKAIEPASRGRRSTQWRLLWRDKKRVRQAFVASLIFGPPKGLEP